MTNMARKRSLIILPKLKNCGGDLSKKWYVEYSCRDPQTNEMKRFRHYDGFAELETVQEREAYAEKIISEIKLKLEKGEDPFSERKVTYQDELIYQAAAARWGNQREGIINIRTYLSDFLLMKKAEVSHSTYQTYCSKLRIFCEWMELQGYAVKHVRCICQDQIHKFFYYIAGENHASRRTVLKYKQLLHTFFDFLMKTKEVITVNPISNIPQLGEKRDEAARPIPDKDRKKLIEYMEEHDPQLLLVCQLEYYCAIRPNECRQLLIRDINLETATITVRQDISKNGLTETVNIPRQLYEYLENILRIGGYPEDWYLFSRDDMPGMYKLGKNTFRYRFNRIRKILGLSERYKLYSFKHTGGVKLVNAGVNTWELQRHFRHKSIDTTEKYVKRNFGVQSKLIRDDFPDM